MTWHPRFVHPCITLYYSDPFYLILALPEMINEGRASLWILASVEAIQFCCDKVQCLVGIEELGQQRRVVSLEDKNYYLHCIIFCNILSVSLPSVKH